MLDARAPGARRRRPPDPARRRRRGRRGFATSQWVDRVVTCVRGHRVRPQFGRPLAAWKARLGELGFSVQSLPMNEGTPFANVLLVGDLPPSRA